MGTAHPATRTALARGTSLRGKPALSPGFGRAPRPFSEEETQRIVAMRKHNKTWVDIATALGRRADTVSAYAKRIGLVADVPSRGNRMQPEPPPRPRRTGPMTDYQIWAEAMARLSHR